MNWSSPEKLPALRHTHLYTRMPKDWKHGLLSSGFPLEVEVSSILINRGFHVAGEFPYTRTIGGESKEFSVDIHAHHYLAKSDNPGEIRGQLHILSECKFRSPEKIWLFSPDMNEPDFSPLTSSAIRQFSMLSSYEYERDPLLVFGRKPRAVVKGVEMFQNGGNSSFDTDIRHAMNQVRYSMPDKVAEIVSDLLESNPEDAKPCFLVPLIVTTAEIWVLKSGVTVTDIQGASALSDIAEATDVVECHSPHSTDFGQHARKAFASFPELRTLVERRPSVLGLLEDYWTRKGRHLTPISAVEHMRHGSSPHPNFYSQFMVANLSKLGETLDQLLLAIHLTLDSARRIV